MADVQKKLKGIVVFFVNMYPDLGQQIEPTLKMFKESAKSLIDRLQADGRYVIIFVPTTKEATRVEKVDYDAPFPRCVARSLDVLRDGVTLRKKKQNLFEDDSACKGFISIFLNFHPELKLDVNSVVALTQAVNEEAIKEIAADAQFDVIIVPTTKEASRVEKVDYDSPFPRFVPKPSGKTKLPIPVKKDYKKIDDSVEEEDDDEDEDEDEE